MNLNYSISCVGMCVWDVISWRSFLVWMNYYSVSYIWIKLNILGFESCLRKLSSWIFYLSFFFFFKDRQQCCEGRMENKVIRSCKRKFLIPEIPDKPLKLCSNAIFVRWGMTVQERVTRKLREENEMRGKLVGNRSRKGWIKKRFWKIGKNSKKQKEVA